ncbi:MAG: hypothetical protein KDC85_16450 [Saprospiraceae bacterium]|nr:hypothetical protein [Saprospiraceae bacterium]
MLGILLVMTFLVPVLGTYGWLHHQKNVVREEVKSQILQGMDKKELVLLKLSQKEARIELKWKGPGEFKYKNQMYDVVESEMAGDSITYWCWWDHEETQLDQKLKTLVNHVLNNDTDGKEKKERLIHYLKSLYCYTSTEVVFPTPPLMFTAFNFIADPYAILFLTPPAPPPKLCMG